MAEHALLQLDQMVNLATENTMLARIMLLEIGPIKYRHAVQNTVRQAGVSALILLFTGEAGTASTLVFLLPILLLQASCSQEFEWQSDCLCLRTNTMAKHGYQCLCG